MAAYVVVDIDVHDLDAYEEYIALAPATVAAHGGRYLARAGRTETLEGDWTPKRFVILEFPDYEAALRWHDADDYAPVKAIRERTATTQMVVTEGR